MLGTAGFLALAVLAWRIVSLPASPEEDENEKLLGLIGANWNRLRSGR